MKFDKRATKAANEWMQPALMFAIYDCCDSMREEEKLRSRFDALVDDKISVEKFIQKSPTLMKNYAKAIVETVKEGSGEWTEEALEDTPSDLPIAYSEAKKFL